MLTQSHLHTVTRPAYEALGERQPLPVPTSEAELAGERPEHYEERLAAGQAEIALAQLARLDENLAHRRRVSRPSTPRALAPMGFVAPVVADDAEPAWVRYPVRVADRDAAIKALRRHTVPGTWFTSVQEEAIRPTINGYVAGTCPNAERAARELVNLPTHPAREGQGRRGYRRGDVERRARMRIAVVRQGYFELDPRCPARGPRAARGGPRGRRDLLRRRGPAVARARRTADGPARAGPAPARRRRRLPG